MTLGALAAALRAHGTLVEPWTAPASIEVTALVYDSRRAQPGSLFVAIRGFKSDGERFAPQAAARGSVAVVAEGPAPPDVGVPWVRVSDARLALAQLADAFYGQPSDQLRIVGITGTNGKTTTAFLVRSVFDAAGLRSGLLGTIVYNTGGEDRDATRTTPEASDVQALLREMVDRGCRAAAIEVSSHALALKRAEAIRFAAGVFTNLTRDHLDFHLNMEAYFAAKRRLFDLLPPGAPAVVNVDDPKGATLAAEVRRPVTYAVRATADVTAQPFTPSLDGLTFTANTPGGDVRVHSRLVGRPNVYNLLAAVATGVALDVPPRAIEEGITRLAAVPGRFQVVSEAADDITVVVDYAHTDDALKNLLDTARALARGRLVTVVGCGGDRDRTKRPLMGAVAGRLSDVVVLTSDNPRSEDPERIIDEVGRGIAAVGPAARVPQVFRVTDRAAAIAKAVALAAAGDLIAIAGKGHERTQVIGDRELPFDDVEVAHEALVRRRGARRAS